MTTWGLNQQRQLDWYESAEVIPGRSLTRSKAPGRLYPIDPVIRGPLYIEASWDRGIAEGALIWPSGSREDYWCIDMVCALGAIVRGYGAQSKRQDKYVYSLPHAYEVYAADAIQRHVAPWATRVRFLKTGSEATHAAYRIAKAYTGRKHVLVGDWSYHGWHEWCDDRDFPFTHRFTHENMANPLHDVALRPDEIAAVFVEPHRWERTNIAALRYLRAWCDLHRILLVFDEMIYGCRWAMGGATEYFGVQPDLACYGKAIANGAPLACVVGSAPLELHGEIPSGTYSGDVSALYQCVQTVTHLVTDNGIKTLWARGRQLRRGIAAVLAEGQYHAVHLEGAGDVHLRLRFDDGALGHEFSAQMAERNVLWHPMVVNITTSHTEAQIETVVTAVEDSLKAMRDNGAAL